MKSRIFSSFFIILVLGITTSEVWAQPGLPTAPSQAPIDGGLSILAVAGGAYALKKLKGKTSLED